MHIMETCYSNIQPEHPNYVILVYKQPGDGVSSPAISVSEPAMALADFSRRRI